MAAVCVFCASSERIDPGFVRLAAEVGTEIARRGHSLVSGGGSVSMMGAVARAAREGGAHTLGVIPEVFTRVEVADVDCHRLVVTQDMRSRKGLMDSSSDAFLALPGGLGTLEELLEVWVAGSVDLHVKPVVVLDPEGVFKPLRAMVEGLCESGFVYPEAATRVVWTTGVREALDAVEAGLAANGVL